MTKIDKMHFGWIMVDGRKHRHDISFSQMMKLRTKRRHFDVWEPFVQRKD